VLKFREWITEQLAARNWSQADLARMTTLTPQAISHYVNGSRMPEPAAVVAIADAFRYPTYDALSLAGYVPPREDRTLISRVIVELTSKLPPEDQELVADYINMLLDRRQRDKIDHPIHEEM